MVLVAPASQNASPHSSIYDFESTGDTDESWQHIDMEYPHPHPHPHPHGAMPGPGVGFVPSPASGASMGGFTLISHPGATPSSSSPSVSASSLAGFSPGQGMSIPGGFFMPPGGGFQPDEEFLIDDLAAAAAATTSTSTMATTMATTAEASAGGAAAESGFSTATRDALMAQQQYLFSQGNELSSQELIDLVPYMSGFEANVPFSAMDPTETPGARSGSHDLGQPWPSELSASAWHDARSSVSADGNGLLLESLSSSSHSSASPLILTPSAGSASPRSPAAKSETSRKSSASGASSSSPPGESSGSGSGSGSSNSIIHKVVRGKVQKSRAAGPGPGSSSQFVIVTPTTISAHAGRPNPFECFEAMRTTTHKGRKGPLANETKESALQVRRVGACFCCHSRKVKCDKERPCRHCKKLMLQVPQVVCWQFQDFLPVLFPDFIRGHFKRDAMARFLAEHVEDIGGAGAGEGGGGGPGGGGPGAAANECRVELSSGPRFAGVLGVRARFFTARTLDVLQHWHLGGRDAGAPLEARRSVPIAVDLSKGPQRDELRKAAKAYVRALAEEPAWAEQVTDSFATTRLPLKVLSIVQAYANRSDSAMVKRALSIYTMHYVMTRHLCLTRESVLSLSGTGLVHPDDPWVTSRVLARQVKFLVDELIMREMTQLFEQFSKSLKPKSRREWAPCLASFLVLCLFMEAVEAASDNFVASQTELEVGGRDPFLGRTSTSTDMTGTTSGGNSSSPGRKLVLDTCKEVENMPFKQFAYQFHHLYQTHSRDANTKSFNPLVDGGWMEHGAELGAPAMEMIAQLRELFYGEDWQDLQFLADDDMVLRGEQRFVMDRSFLYTGRLVAKCLLSFTNESIIFGSQI